MGAGAGVPLSSGTLPPNTLMPKSEHLASEYSNEDEQGGGGGEDSYELEL